MAKRQNRSLPSPEPTQLDDARINPHIGLSIALHQAEGEIITIRTVPLDEIRVDMAQPRRGIPFAIRGGWDGSPEQIPGILRRWQQAAVNAIEQRIDTAAILNGQGELPEPIIDPTDDKPVPFPAMVNDYLELMALAHSIKDEGLINPITIVENADGYMIETGERRYLAAWMIRAFVGNMETINAQVMPSFNLMRQAKENTARLQLNAISMARQLARLLIYLYEQNGDAFQSFHELVQPGKSDRPYYAQVADGNQWRVKKDWRNDFLNAMNLPSTRQVSAYRALLSLDDDMWIRADNENWSLNAIQTEIDRRTGSNITGVNTPQKEEGYMHVTSDEDDLTLPIGKVNPDNPPSVTPADAAIAFQVGDPIRHIETKMIGRIIAISDDGDRAQIELIKYRETPWWFIDSIELISDAEWETAHNAQNSPFASQQRGNPFADQNTRVPTTPTWKDPAQNRVSLEPTDTIIEGGRSGNNVNVHQQPTPEPFADRRTFNRFDRVDTDWGQGVINAIEGSRYHVTTFDEAGRRTNRIFLADGIVKIDEPIIGQYATTEEGAYGIVEEITNDGSQITIRIYDNNGQPIDRLLHRSANEVHILFDYAPDDIDIIEEITPPADFAGFPNPDEHLHIYGEVAALAIQHTGNINQITFDFLEMIIDEDTDFSAMKQRGITSEDIAQRAHLIDETIARAFDKIRTTLVQRAHTVSNAYTNYITGEQ